MKKSIVAATALLIPAALFAEVQITFNANAYVTDQSNNSDNDNDEWFEDAGSNGSANLSFEYQWCSNNGRRILQYRQVSFYPVTGAWAFGDWMVKNEYCHSSCPMHHEHHFYHHTSYAPQWRREYSRDDYRPHYYYDRRYEHHRYQEPVREYHEYTPPMRHEHPGRSFGRVFEKNYSNQDYGNYNDPRYDNSEQRRSHQEQNNHWRQKDQQHQNYQPQRGYGSDRQPMVRVTEKERIMQ